MNKQIIATNALGQPIYATSVCQKCGSPMGLDTKGKRFCTGHCDKRSRVAASPGFGS